MHRRQHISSWYSNQIQNAANSENNLLWSDLNHTIDGMGNIRRCNFGKIVPKHFFCKFDWITFSSSTFAKGFLEVFKFQCKIEFNIGQRFGTKFVHVVHGTMVIFELLFVTPFVINKLQIRNLFFEETHGTVFTYVVKKNSKLGSATIPNGYIFVSIIWMIRWYKLMKCWAASKKKLFYPLITMVL